MGKTAIFLIDMRADSDLMDKMNVSVPHPCAATWRAATKLNPGWPAKLLLSCETVVLDRLACAAASAGRVGLFVHFGGFLAYLLETIVLCLRGRWFDIDDFLEIGNHYLAPV
jgi:hypothetical protein